MVKVKLGGSSRGFLLPRLSIRQFTTLFLVGSIVLITTWTHHLIEFESGSPEDYSILSIGIPGDTTLQSDSANKAKPGSQNGTSSLPELVIGEYRDPAVQFGYRAPMSLKDGESLPIPVQVMEEYMSIHSVESLRKNPDLEHRKFAIGKR